MKIINFILTHKLSLFMTILTSLPVCYYIYGELVESIIGNKVGQGGFEIFTTPALYVSIIGVVVAGIIIFKLFNQFIGKWTFYLLIPIAPIVYYFAMIIGLWVGIISRFIIMFLFRT